MKKSDDSENHILVGLQLAVTSKGTSLTYRFQYISLEEKGLLFQVPIRYPAYPPVRLWPVRFVDKRRIFHQKKENES